jgi:hypothetical protein
MLSFGEAFVWTIHFHALEFGVRIEKFLGFLFPLTLVDGREHFGADRFHFAVIDVAVAGE